MPAKSRFFIAVLFIAAPAIAQYDLSWHTIDAGGATSCTGGSFTLGGTIGQPDSQTPPIMTGGSFALSGGFWSGIAIPTCPLLGDMNADTHRNGMDVQTFVNCLLGINGSNCTCADFSGNGTVGPEDLPGFLNTMLTA